MARLIAGLLLAGLLPLMPIPDAFALEAKDLIYIRPPTPAYPNEARRKGQEGTAVVHVAIPSSGVPARVSISRSSGFPLLDKAAVEALEATRYRPFHDDVDQLVTTLVPVKFSLTQRVEGNRSTARFFTRSCRDFNDEVAAYRTAAPGAPIENMGGFDRALNEMQALLQLEPPLSSIARAKSREERRGDYAAAFPGIFASTVERCRRNPASTYGNAIIDASREAGFLETEADLAARQFRPE